MTTFDRVWNPTYESLPLDTEQESLGAGRMRNIKVDVRERMQVDHSWAGTVDDGMHEAVTLMGQTADPTVVAPNAGNGAGWAYTKQIGGNNELFYEDSSGAVTQLTKAGTLNTTVLVGEIKIWPSATPPAGFLLCDGTTYNTATYPLLFGVVGYTYGGSVSNFQVPDLRARVPVGYDAGGGTGRMVGNGYSPSAAGIGEAGGQENHTLTTAELPNQSYNATDLGHNHGYLSPRVGGNTPTFENGGGTYNSGNSENTGVSFAQIEVTDNNGNGPHNVVQPCLVLNYIIKHD